MGPKWSMLDFMDAYHHESVISDFLQDNTPFMLLSSGEKTQHHMTETKKGVGITIDLL